MFLTAYAQSSPQPSAILAAGQRAAEGVQNIGTIADAFTEVLGGSVIAVLISVTLASFLVGGIYYMWQAKKGGADAAKTKWFLLNGIIILTVMVSIWGIVTLVSNLVLGDKSNVKTIQPAQVLFQPGSGASPGSPLPLGGSPSAGAPLTGGTPLPAGITPSAAGAGRGGTNLPVGASCQLNTQCTSGLCSSGGVCKLSLGSTCDSNSDCDTNYCQLQASGQRGTCWTTSSLVR